MLAREGGGGALFVDQWDPVGDRSGKEYDIWSANGGGGGSLHTILSFAIGTP